MRNEKASSPTPNKNKKGPIRGIQPRPRPDLPTSHLATPLIRTYSFAPIHSHPSARPLSVHTHQHIRVHIDAYITQPSLTRTSVPILSCTFVPKPYLSCTCTSAYIHDPTYDSFAICHSPFGVRCSVFANPISTRRVLLVHKSANLINRVSQSNQIKSKSKSHSRVPTW